MNWSNWVYLAAGLALGWGFCWLFTRVESRSSQKSETNKDVPALVQQLNQTQLAYQMAREISQFKAGFLARTTHVLRSPLNGLIGLHQLILSDLCENPEEEREFVTQAHERALKLLKLIDEILNVARTEQGTNKLDIQPVQLAELLNEVHDLTYMLAENRNYPYKVLPPDPEIYVLADPRWLRLVLVNLIETAIAKMEEGSICISTAPTSDFVHIWLDVPDDAICTSEPIDLIEFESKQGETDKDAAVLQGMKLLLNQTLLQVMGAKLEIVASGAAKPCTNLVRLQVSIPLVIPEAEFDLVSANQA